MLAELYVHGKPAPIGENSALSHPFCVLPPRHLGDTVDDLNPAPSVVTWSSLLGHSTCQLVHGE